MNIFHDSNQPTSQI